MKPRRFPPLILQASVRSWRNRRPDLLFKRCIVKLDKRTDEQEEDFELDEQEDFELDEQEEDGKERERLPARIEHGVTDLSTRTDL